jgi:hypothetical protein
MDGVIAITYPAPSACGLRSIPERVQLERFATMARRKHVWRPTLHVEAMGHDARYAGVPARVPVAGRQSDQASPENGSRSLEPSPKALSHQPPLSERVVQVPIRLTRSWTPAVQLSP